MWPPVLVTPQARDARGVLVKDSQRELCAGEIHTLELEGWGSAVALGSLALGASPAVVIGAEAVDLEFKREVFRVSARMIDNVHRWGGPGTGPKPRWVSLIDIEELDLEPVLNTLLSVSVVRDTSPVSFDDESSLSVIIDGAVLLESSSGDRLLLDAQIDRYPGLLPTWLMATTDQELITARLHDAELVSLAKS